VANRLFGVRLNLAVSMPAQFRASGVLTASEPQTDRRAGPGKVVGADGGEVPRGCEQGWNGATP